MGRTPTDISLADDISPRARKVLSYPPPKNAVSAILRKTPPALSVAIARVIYGSQFMTILSAAIYLWVTGSRATPEPEFLHILPEVRGKTVVEVGANTGSLTRMLSQAVGREGVVVAVEPNPLVYWILRLSLRSKVNVKTMNVGIWKAGKGREMLWFGVDLFNTRGASIKTDYGTPIGTMCRFMSLDDLVSSLGLPKIDYLLIDAEGAESEVIDGGMRTLRATFPCVLVECHTTVTDGVVDSVSARLEGMGYEREGPMEKTGDVETYSFRSSRRGL
jgi:FkbM family methyltransferase